MGSWYDFFDLIRHSNGQVLNTVVKRNGSDMNVAIYPVQDKDEEGQVRGVSAWLRAVSGRSRA